MPRLRSIVHKELHRHLARSFFTRTVTIQVAGTGLTASGHPTGTPTDLPGHVDISAAIEPVNERGNAERRLESITVGEQTHDILLLGYFPAITTHHQAVDDAGEVYGLTKVEHDSARTLTRLLARQVTPVAREGD